jgi:DHA1 family tetracycline resistance protein-like MFS transporter
MQSRRPLALLFTIVIIDLIGFGIVVPVLPFIVEAFDASASLLGLLVASYAAMQFVFAPIWGRLSDRIGRRPVLLMTIAGSASALLLAGLAPSLFWLFVARIVGGGFAANISVASAYITDATDESERTRWMGLLGASFAVGFTLGPAIGGALGPLGYHVPLLVAAAMAGANFLWAVAVLREPEAPEATEASEVPAGSRAPEGPADASGAVASPLVRRICWANLFFSLAVTQLETVFAFLMMAKFDYDLRAVAFILVGMAVVMGGVQGGGIRALAARFGERSLLYAGAVLMAVAFVGIPFAPSVGLLLAPLAVSAVGRGICQPSMMSLVSSFATPATRGQVLGTFTSRASLARAIGPLPAGLLFDVWMGGPFFVAAALLVAMLACCTGFPARVGDELSEEA